MIPLPIVAALEDAFPWLGDWMKREAFSADVEYDQCDNCGCNAQFLDACPFCDHEVEWVLTDKGRDMLRGDPDLFIRHFMGGKDVVSAQRTPPDA